AVLADHGDDLHPDVQEPGRSGRFGSRPQILQMGLCERRRHGAQAGLHPAAAERGGRGRGELEADPGIRNVVFSRDVRAGAEAIPRPFPLRRAACQAGIMPRLSIRIDFDKGSLGPGKAHLLELVASTGSIRKAAAGMKMSYRKAWLLLKA